MSAAKKSLFNLTKAPYWVLPQLEELAQQYPYFSAVHWLIARDLYEATENPTLPAVEHAFLHTSSPYALDVFLQSSRIDAQLNEEAGEVEIEKPAINQQELLPHNLIINEDTLEHEKPNLVGVVDTNVSTAIEYNKEDTNNIEDDSFEDEITELEGENQIENQPIQSLELDLALKDLVQQVTEKTPMQHGEMNESLTFEPYHTVDYFASQGISIKEDAPSANVLDTQLKSFTEWLRVFKKTPTQSPSTSMTAVQEQVVVEKARQSVNETEIMTEAMAQVWIRQGQLHKAIHIYEKLSLLNPDKSSYFATQIERLKQA